MKQHEALVYMTKDEALKFVGIPSLSKKKGRRPIESDDFCLEVLRSVAKEKPKLNRENIRSDVIIRLEKRKKEGVMNYVPSESWMKEKLKLAYETLGWIAADPVS